MSAGNGFFFVLFVYEYMSTCPELDQTGCQWIYVVYFLSWKIFKMCLLFSLVMDQDYESRLLRQINIQENASPVVS
jgi:hypothetical protein